MTHEDRRGSGTNTTHNAAGEFAAAGLDPLEMAGRFCREQGLEFFLSVRVNDTHDAAGTTENPNPHFSPFKKAHPDCLMGASSPKSARPPNGRWSAVDFTRAEVRAYMLKFMREFVEHYDLDGVEYDFVRHLHLLRSVAWGGSASAEELELMTGFMRELRGVTEEAGRRRGRPILVAVRMPDSVELLKGVGIDAERWFREKLVDIWIAGGYFRLKPWSESAALAHRYGVKHYASIDESRVEGQCGRSGTPFIRGRATTAAYAAEFAPSRAARKDYPVRKGGARVDFTMVLGDDFSMPSKKPRTQAIALTDLRTCGGLVLKVNGRDAVLDRFRDGQFVFRLPSGALVKGVNSFSVFFPETAGDAKLVDFAVDVRFPVRKPMVVFNTEKISSR